MMQGSKLVFPWQPQSSWDEAEDAEASAAEPIPGDPRRSAFAGAVAGWLGGWLALALEQGLVDRERLFEYARIAMGSGSTSVGASAIDVWSVVAAAAVAGMAAGACLGWLMRRLHRFVGRAVFAAVLVPSVWIAFDAFALSRFAPSVAELVPFVPAMIATALYGVCVAIARPVVLLTSPAVLAHARVSPWESPDPLPSYPSWGSAFRSLNEPGASSTGSFPLTRRK